MLGGDLSIITDARLLRALAWWRGLAPQSLIPASGLTIPDRALLDPAAIPDLLPHVTFWEVLPRAPDGKRQFRCRLAGTAMVEIHGYEFSGQMMPDFHGPKNDQIQPEYEWVADQGRPHYVERTLFWQNRDYVRYRRILLPFVHAASGRSQTVAFILNVAHFLAAGED